MTTDELKKIVSEAVASASASSDKALSDEKRRSNYLRASQSGQFKTRNGIFEYFRAYEDMTAEEALKATEIDCIGR